MSKVPNSEGETPGDDPLGGEDLARYYTGESEHLYAPLQPAYVVVPPAPSRRGSAPAPSRRFPVATVAYLALAAVVLLAGAIALGSFLISKIQQTPLRPNRSEITHAQAASPRPVPASQAPANPGVVTPTATRVLAVSVAAPTGVESNSSKPQVPQSSPAVVASAATPAGSRNRNSTGVALPFYPGQTPLKVPPGARVMPHNSFVHSLPGPDGYVTKVENGVDAVHILWSRLYSRPEIPGASMHHRDIKYMVTNVDGTTEVQSTTVGTSRHQSKWKPMFTTMAPKIDFAVTPTPLAGWDPVVLPNGRTILQKETITTSTDSRGRQQAYRRIQRRGMLGTRIDATRLLML